MVVDASAPLNPPRVGSHGDDRYFVDVATFEKLDGNGEFLEKAFVHGNWYATSATWLREQVAAGQDVLLEIDWQGATQVRRLIPSAVHVFILPPSGPLLKERLERRGHELDELDDGFKDWNAQVEDEGRLVPEIARL